MTSDYVEARDGAYYVRGSRVSLDSIITGFRDGHSPETIRDNFPTLKLEQIYGAVTFYLSHQAEMDAYVDAGRKSFEEARQSQQIPEELRTRLQAAREQLTPRT
jgi:uncharacterized protein (DUF433 family)